MVKDEENLDTVLPPLLGGCGSFDNHLRRGVSHEFLKIPAGHHPSSRLWQNGMQRTSGFAWQCAFRGAWRRQRCALPLFLVSTVGGREPVPKPKRQGRAESFLSYRWTLGPPTVLLPCKYTLSTTQECYLLFIQESQWLIFLGNFQIGQLFLREGSKKCPNAFFGSWWPGVVFRAWT